jgi:hypothetical protein
MWAVLMAAFLFVVLPECIKAFEFRHEHLLVTTPTGELMIATRRLPLDRWAEQVIDSAGRITNSLIRIANSKTLDYSKKLSWMLCVQCWKAAMFLFAWVINTTTEFKVKIFIAILLTFATDFHKGVYEKCAEGGDAWQMLKAGLDAMVIITSIFLFLVRKLIIDILAVTAQ